MTMLTGTRLWRPSAVSLILVVLVAILAPLTISPTEARADVCDLPGVSTVCDGAKGAASAAGDAVEGVVDAGKSALKGVVKGVKTATKWAGKNVGKILAAAVAIGVPLLTWVACSKVTKVIAAAGGGAAGAAGSGGVATGGGAIAGAAGAEAVCKLVKTGGKLLLKVGKKGLKNAGKLANIAKLASGAVGLAAIVYGVDHGSAWVLQNLLNFDAESAPHLDAGWLTKLRESLNGLGVVLLLLATILGMTVAGAMGRTSDVGRIFTSMISVALIIGVVGSLLLAGLRVSDDVTSGTLNSQWGQKALGNWKDLGDSYADATPKKDDDKAAADDTAEAATTSQTGTPPADEKGPWPIRLLISLCTMVCGALVWLEMQIRDALLYLLLAFGGLLLAGYPFPATRGIAKRFGMTLLGVVVAKPVIVITLLLGGAMMQTAAADGDGVVPLLQGAGLMVLAALMGSAVLAWFNLHGAAAMNGLGNRIAGRSGSAAAAGAGAGIGAASNALGGRDKDGDGGTPVDPKKDLQGDVRNRVDAASDADGNGPGGGDPSSSSPRLRAAQEREQADARTSTGTPDHGGGAPDSGPSASDAPTEAMPTAGSDPLRTSEGAREQPVDAAGAARAPTDNGTPAAGLAAAAAVGAAGGALANGAHGPDAPPASTPPGAAGVDQSPTSSMVPDGPGADAGVGASGVAEQGAPAPGEVAPRSTEAAGGGAGHHGAAPVGGGSVDASTVAAHAGSGMSERPVSPGNADAYAAFGAPGPQDAAAAFGDHAEQVRQALDGRPEVRS